MEYTKSAYFCRKLLGIILPKTGLQKLFLANPELQGKDMVLISRLNILRLLKPGNVFLQCGGLRGNDMLTQMLQDLHDSMQITAVTAAVAPITADYNSNSSI